MTVRLAGAAGRARHVDRGRAAERADAAGGVYRSRAQSSVGAVYRPLAFTVPPPTVTAQANPEKGMAAPNWSSSVALKGSCAGGDVDRRGRDHDSRCRLVNDDGNGVGGHVAELVGHGRGKDVGAGRVESGRGVIGGVGAVDAEGGRGRAGGTVVADQV